MAQEQPGARRFVRFVVGVGRRGGRRGRRHVGRRAAALRRARHARTRPRRLLRRHRRQGFQDSSSTPGGSVAYCCRSGLLSAAYSLLHICEALLSTANHLQGEQKTVWVRGRRGDAFGGKCRGRRGRRVGRRARRARTVLARAPPRRLVLRRVLAVQRRGGRAPAPIPHRLAASTPTTSGHVAPGGKLTKWVAAERVAWVAPQRPAAERVGAQPGAGPRAGRGGAQRARVAQPGGAGAAAAERAGRSSSSPPAPAQRLLCRWTRRRTRA
ncbi:uncharacterized protein LOC111359725 [Spodoptera litura]|uniref:Uncharacterized protein LOC111359725 n=1 Tax=Spodoptera litura TaxID=69820 RepID=A0A9J7ELZ7_SPOLT|nr:uncharacterized protein LOC111359725 [Spodoptera litura]